LREKKDVNIAADTIGRVAGIDVGNRAVRVQVKLLVGDKTKELEFPFKHNQLEVQKDLLYSRS
jgi:hypothetical protein